MLTAIAVVPPQGKLVVGSGEKTKTLDWGDLEAVQGPARPARRSADAGLAGDRPGIEAAYRRDDREAEK